MASINFSQSILQSAVGTALQSLGLTNNASAAAATQPDNSQLSPFAQMMSTLKQLQQTNPTQYAQVTQQISTNLQQAAQTATSSGNTAAASQLNQLATVFSNASQSGQLPNAQALAQALGGGHHHHHGSEANSSDSAAPTATSTSVSQSISQLLAAFQSNSSQSASATSTDPMSIIMSTLSNAGVNNQPS